LARYLAGRLIQALLLLLGVSLLTFTIIQLAPGRLVEIVGKAVDAAALEDQARLRALWRLDQPVHVQYWRWLQQVVRGNFGHGPGGFDLRYRARV
jgi:peptide/nickel transport system permease protein